MGVTKDKINFRFLLALFFYCHHHDVQYKWNGKKIDIFFFIFTASSFPFPFPLPPSSSSSSSSHLHHHIFAHLSSVSILPHVIFKIYISLLIHFNSHSFSLYLPCLFYHLQNYEWDKYHPYHPQWDEIHDDWKGRSLSSSFSIKKYDNPIISYSS